MGEGKSLAALVDAALAQQDRLPAAGERVADDLPFLEANGSGHGCWGINRSTKIVRGHRGLLTGTEQAGLLDHPFGGGFKAVAVAVRADRGTIADDRIAALANLVASGSGGDFRGGRRACGRGWVWHVGNEKAVPDVRPA